MKSFLKHLGYFVLLVIVFRISITASFMLRFFLDVAITNLNSTNPQSFLIPIIKVIITPTFYLTLLLFTFLPAHLLTQKLKLNPKVTYTLYGLFLALIILLNL